MDRSIWKYRPKWAESRDFYDTEEVYEAAFSLDWSRALRSHRLAEWILKHDDGDGEDSDDDDDEGMEGGGESGEIIEVGNILWRHHRMLYAAFDCYASIDSKGDVTSITYSAFKLFVQDIKLAITGSAHCDSADYDRLFIMINSKDMSGSKQKGSKFEFSEATVGKHGMACSMTGTNVDKRELVRHEWFSCLVRIAIMRYVASGEEQDVSEAVGRLITSDILHTRPVDCD